MAQQVPRSKSRKVNGYVRAALAFDAARKKRDERYDRYVRRLDEKLDRLTLAVQRRNALAGGQLAEARWILNTVPTINAIKECRVRYAVPGERGVVSSCHEGVAMRAFDLAATTALPCSRNADGTA